MISEKVRYRVHQFFLTLFPGSVSQESLTHINEVLPPEQAALFSRMQQSEQVHSLRVYHALIAIGENDNDLLTAALLHDVGKIVHPLRVWERVLIVLASAFIPRLSRAWGSGEPRGLKRAFVISKKHPAWGADLAAEVGVSPLAAALIRRHQDPVPEVNEGDELLDFLTKLQKVDNQS